MGGNDGSQISGMKKNPQGTQVNSAYVIMKELEILKQTIVATKENR